MSETLEQVLADARGELPLLRRRKASWDPDAIGEFLDRVASATEDFRRFISEDDARLQSGKSVAWLRARFNEWVDSGNAEKRGRKRYYRACIIPRRPDLEAARAAGRRGDSNAA